MNIVHSGSTYTVYPNGLQTYQLLPVKTYTINFDKNSGFFLSDYNDIEIKEKTYGVHAEKIKKVMNSFSKSDRNLGVILSGDKGIGKSLFAKIIAIESIKNNMPVIVVNNYYPGISDFINSISQKICLIFDEFDKTFCGDTEQRDSLNDPQTEMLSLFDGISQGKKMFIITCNSLNKLNDYLVNRPGRFHYHFRFDYPDSDSIVAYLSDKGVTKEEIEKVIAFSTKVKLNYDCLRSIAFELNQGYNFEDAIKDLNIINQNEESYSITVYFDDGSKIRQNARLDMFSNNTERINFDVPGERYAYLGTLEFIPNGCDFDSQYGGMVISKDSPDASWTFDEDVLHPDKDVEIIAERWTKKKFAFAIIKHYYGKDIHYTV